MIYYWYAAGERQIKSGDMTNANLASEISIHFKHALKKGLDDVISFELYTTTPVVVIPMRKKRQLFKLNLTFLYQFKNVVL